LEIAHAAVQRVIQREIGSPTECRVFDGYSIPYSKDTSDLIVLTHVVEHTLSIRENFFTNLQELLTVFF
jgi:hypothetical protein